MTPKTETHAGLGPPLAALCFRVCHGRRGLAVVEYVEYVEYPVERSLTSQTFGI